ncbi:hypothetical protein [Variovorax sp. GT1P44]|uniref:hypothetical protein n=1 Tax=Variovorax sp. GT1P44 TaxID=3443742 RepID=UPI003F45FE78
MTTLNRIFLVLVLALMALGGVQYHLLKQSNAALEVEQETTRLLRRSIAANEAGQKARTKAAAAATKAAAKRTKELNHATEANRAWADAPVPDAVWDSLYGPAAPPAAP